MTGFNNPIIGGGGALVYPSIHSPDFATGVSGWTIRKDGSAEFDNVIIRGGEIISGTELFYSGTPALGNLIVSVAAAGGTDGVGNLYLGGVTNYYFNGGVFYALNLFQGIITMYTATSASGPWTQASAINMDVAATGNLLLTPSNEVEVNGSLLVDFAVAAASGAFSEATSAGSVLSVTNTTANPAAPAEQIISAGTGDRAFGIMISGDTKQRFQINANGQLQWGPGNAAVDTLIHRTGVAQLSADTILANVGGSVETWHSLGTLANYTVGAGRYRLTTMNEVEIDLEVSSAGANAATTTFQNVLPAAYRPLADRHQPLSCSKAVAAGDVSPRVFVQASTGSVMVLQTASVTASLGVTLRIPLD